MLRRIYWFVLDWWAGKTTLLGGSLRSNKWSAVRAEHLKKFPACAVCNRRGTIFKPNSVHHLRPFHLFPEEELNPENLATACTRCHLLIFHLNNFKSYNLEALMDAKIWKQKIRNRP